MNSAELAALERAVQEQRLVDQAARAADVHALGPTYRPVADSIASIESARLTANEKAMQAGADRLADIRANPELSDAEKAQRCQTIAADIDERKSANNAQALQKGEEIYRGLPDSVGVPYRDAQEALQSRYELEKARAIDEQQRLRADEGRSDPTLGQMKGPPGSADPREQQPPQEPIRESKFVDLRQTPEPDRNPQQAAPSKERDRDDLSR